MKVKKLDPSLFQVGKRQDREQIWNSGTQEMKPTRKFATKNNLMLGNDGAMEGEQSVKDAWCCSGQQKNQGSK